MWLPAGIAVFAFNRPEVMNAMSRKLVMQVSSDPQHICIVRKFDLRVS